MSDEDKTTPIPLEARFQNVRSSEEFETLTGAFESIKPHICSRNVGWGGVGIPMDVATGPQGSIWLVPVEDIHSRQLRLNFEKYNHETPLSIRHSPSKSIEPDQTKPACYEIEAFGHHYLLWEENTRLIDPKDS